MKVKNQKLIFDILGKNCLHIPIKELSIWLDVVYSTISSYRSGQRQISLSPDEFFEKVFIPCGKGKEVEKKAIIQNICSYLDKQNLLSNRLVEYANLGYESFIMALLSFDLNDIPEPPSEKSNHLWTTFSQTTTAITSIRFIPLYP